MRVRSVILLLPILGLMSACASTVSNHGKDSPPVDLQKISQELPDEQLLDVWIELFDPGELPTKEKEALGLSKEIRAAEARYMPIHLRSVMEKTGYWGAVRVVPYGTEGAEVLVRGLIVDSNGEELKLQITAYPALLLYCCILTFFIVSIFKIKLFVLLFLGEITLTYVTRPLW